MKTDRKLTDVEKFIINNTDTSKYTIRCCEKDGIFAVRKDVDKKLCPYCKKECDKYID